MKTNWPVLRSGFMILTSLAVGSTVMTVRAQEIAGVTSTPTVISSVAILQSSSQRASVRVEGEGKLEARAARLQNPDRLVLDFSGARLGSQKTVIAGAMAPILGVRLGQFRDDVVRVVIDLTEASHFQLSHDGAAVVVLFNEASGSSNGTAASNSTSNSSSVTTKPTLNANNSKKSAISSPRFALPGELTQPSIKLASFGGKSEASRPTTNEAQAAQQASQQANTAAGTMAQSMQVSPMAAPAGRYTGEPISVNLKDVDLRDFFRLIHEISGLNVVLDPAVKGTLTIVLDEVPWDQALDIVLQNNSLDKQLNGNVLRIATRDTLKKEAETERDLERAQAEAVAPVTVTRVLSYSKAATLKDTLKKFLSARGDILSDDRSNQLIIRDIPSVIPTIDNLIRQLDRKSQQVEIEARVVSASRSFAQDIGTELGFAGSTTSGRSLFSGTPAVGGSGVTTGAGVPASPVSIGTGSASGNGITSGIPLVTSLSAGVPTSGLGFSHRSPNFAIDFFITAAEAKGVGKLLSKPKVITQNNEKAIIKQGTKVPIQTTINNTISVQFIDAVLKLEVTPQITAEGTVFMDVLVENTQIDTGIPRVQGVPALDTQSAETKVTVADGGTVVIGGIIITNQRVDITQVPVVGSIPLIGNLFKRTNVSVTSQELLFFLTPRIIPG
ncbi:MAG: type pilus assembly protein PilQ [Acidobacteriaceae bacterium]|jgi:type IV pilus secretin PilQ/predicted competence protein|nr:type pilus assembly protein PilQ [Acidobacteriaceae bacterium]